MNSFTIPQRKAYVQMLEKYQSRVESNSRIGYSERQNEREDIGKKFGLAAAQKKVDEIEDKVKAEAGRRDEKFAEDKRKELKALALAMSEIWASLDADEAKQIVQKFVEIEFPNE